MEAPVTDSLTTIKVPVRSTDMDADRRVNNAVYFMYFQEARLAHLQRLGIIRTPRQPEDPNPFTIVANDARYFAPTVYPDTLEITARTDVVRTRSFILAYQAVRLSDGVRVAEGSSAQVWLDADGRAVPLPDAVREALEGSLLPIGDSSNR